MSKGTGLVKLRERYRRLLGVFPERAEFYLEQIAQADSDIATAQVCRLCGKPLTNPEAIERGYGKECLTRIGGNNE